MNATGQDTPPISHSYSLNEGPGSASLLWNTEEKILLAIGVLLTEGENLDAEELKALAEATDMIRSSRGEFS